MARTLVVLAILLFASSAQSHIAPASSTQPFGWMYDPSCCSIRDCAPMPPGEIVATEQGWRVESTGEVIPYTSSKIKRSRDDLFHRCAISGDFTRKTSLCLYVPDMGF